jgi:CMP-N-acetylneuraminic acid synthetase
MTDLYILGQICARGGSKGVPRKNVRPLAGKPLIAWSIECGLNCPSLEKVVVSTEDEEIAAVARECGAEVPFMRPADLAADDSPEWRVWQHTIRSIERIEGRMPDILVTLPATSPLRSVDDVETCVKMLIEKGTDACITVRESERNPYFNMVKVDDGMVSPLIKDAPPVYRRQDAPAVFDITTVAYAARSDFVLSAARLMDGAVCAVTVPAERALDIDTLLDFDLAELIMKRRQHDRDA